MTIPLHLYPYNYILKSIPLYLYGGISGIRFYEKFFVAKNLFFTKNFFLPKIFFYQKFIFLLKIYFLLKIFFYQKFIFLLKIYFLPKIFFCQYRIQYQYPNTVLILLHAYCPLIIISCHPHSVLCPLYHGTNYFLLIFGKNKFLAKKNFLVKK
jgi:hypothetical protein